MAKMATKKTKTALNKNSAGKGAVKITKKVKHHSTVKKTTKESKTPMTKKETKTGTETRKAAQASTTKAHAKSNNMVTKMKSDTACADAQKALQILPLTMRTDLGHEASRAISGALNLLLADVFALFLKTKNFHWHVSGPHFRDYHLLFDDQAGEIFEMIDGIAERARKVGGTTIRSIGNIAQLQRISDNNADYVEPSDMLAELYEDNLALVQRLREVHYVCDSYNDSATTGLLDGWIDESEQRSWFLFETSRHGDSSGR